MVDHGELEQLILARSDPALRMLALSEAAIAKMCHDPALASRLRGFLQAVRNELSAFAVRVEDGGGYRSADDVGVALEREFVPVEAMLRSTLEMIDHKLHLGAPIGRA
jgi:hypothetical protein